MTSDNGKSSPFTGQGSKWACEMSKLQKQLRCPWSLDILDRGMLLGTPASLPAFFVNTLVSGDVPIEAYCGQFWKLQDYWYLLFSTVVMEGVISKSDIFKKYSRRNKVFTFFRNRMNINIAGKDAGGPRQMSKLQAWRFPPLQRFGATRYRQDNVKIL